MPSASGGAANGAWNDHRLTLAEGEAFARDGVLVLPDRLPEQVTDRLEEAFDKVWAAERAARGKGKLDKLNMLDFLSKDERFLEMIDWPAAFPKNAMVDRERSHVDPPGATVVLVPRGGMVLFDRRIWHTGTENYADFPRKALFYGYSYRWLRPRDDMQVAHYLERCDPIRRQLLGTSPSGGRGHTSPQPGDVPLRAWLEQNPTDPEVAAAAGAPTF